MTEVDALQTCWPTEHAAVYVYGAARLPHLAVRRARPLLDACGRPTRRTASAATC